MGRFVNKTSDSNHGRNIKHGFRSNVPSDFNDILNHCMETLNSKLNGLRTLNIIVAGKTGAGKSTLINAVFREDVADTGIGRHVTKYISKHSKKGFPLTIYDTRGLELDKDVQIKTVNEIKETIREGALSENIDDHIHCIWYCINAGSNRVEDEEINLLRELTNVQGDEYAPVIVILTQVINDDNARELKKYITKQIPDVCQVVPVMAKAYTVNNGTTLPPKGLDKLIQVMEEVLPDELQVEFQNTQKVSLEGKINLSRKIVEKAAATSMVVGATPIPIADAFLLVPIEILMLVNITIVFGIRHSKSIIPAFLTALIGISGATMVGKTFISHLMKLVPGLNAASNMISAATADILTKALGEAYIRVMSAIWKGEIKVSDLKTEKGKEKIRLLIEESIREH